MTVFYLLVSIGVLILVFWLIFRGATKELQALEDAERYIEDDEGRYEKPNRCSSPRTISRNE